jgi:hypothetical protein
VDTVNIRAVRTNQGCDDRHHILDLFCGDESNIPRELVICLDRLLQDMWNGKLKRDFSEREIVVSFPDEHYDDLLAYKITIYRKKHVI